MPFRGQGTPNARKSGKAPPPDDTLEEAAYLKSLYRYNETHTFEYGGQKFKAKIVDVGEDGKLVLEYGNNLTGRYDFKTIHFVLNEKDS